MTGPDPAWRSDRPVLVAESHTVGSIAVIRSLGRAGYPVHACSARPDALGFRSAYATVSSLCPPYDSEAFVPWLRQWVADHGIRAIIPSEGMILALRPHFAEFAVLLATNQEETHLYQGMSKVDLFAALSAAMPEGDPHLPPFLLLDRDLPFPDASALALLGQPLFVKVDGVYDQVGDDSGVYRMDDPAETAMLIEKLLDRYDKALVQGYVPGQGVGAFFLLWNGDVVAEFMHRRLHEVPHRGGASSFRESWWHDAIRADAEAKLRQMSWQGVAMLEYRWDPVTDRFWLMELNGRFWGSLHLALYAGVDFPRMLLDAFFGRAPGNFHRGRLGVRARNTFPSEAQYVWSIIKDPDLGIVRKLGVIAEFFLLFLNPCVRSDLLFPGDRGLYFRRFWRFLRTLS